MAAPIKLALPPGLVRTAASDYQASGRYSDANLMRWVLDGQAIVLKPIKGWTFTGLGYVDGDARAAHGWLDNDEAPYAAVGTVSGLYIADGITNENITPSGFVAGSDLSTWTLDNFGELLVACNDSDEKLYEYQPGGGGDATLITNSPSAKATFVTKEKFIFALAVNGDPRSFAWCDQENRTVWTASAINQAGDLPINEVGALMCGLNIRAAALIFTTEGVHRLEFIGMPDVYSSEHIANGCGIVSRHAAAFSGSTAFWMGDGRFFSYIGYVEPMDCEIGDDVFTNLNADYVSKVWALHQPQFSEIWWFYPRGEATECTHAAIYNYRKNFWNHCEMPRLAGFEKGVFSTPIMVSPEGRIMLHETGFNYDENVTLTADDGAVLTTDDGLSDFIADPGDPDAVPSRPYARSGPIEIGNGERQLIIDEFRPDEANQGDCETYFHLKEQADSAVTTIGPFASSARVGVDSVAGMASIEYRAAEGTEDFRIGIWRAVARQWGVY